MYSICTCNLFLIGYLYTVQPTILFVNVSTFQKLRFCATLMYYNTPTCILKNCMFCEQFCGSAFISIRIRVRDQNFRSSGSGSGSRDLMAETCKENQNFLCHTPQLKRNQFFIKIWNTLYLSLGLNQGCPSYGRSLQPSKENIQHFKTLLFPILLEMSKFCPPGSGSGSSRPN